MRKSLFLMAVSVMMLFAVAAPAGAQNANDKEYRDVLEKMLTLSGALKTAETIVPQMVSGMKKAAPSVADSYWDSFAAKWKVKFADRMVDLYVPIYQKYLTIDDLKGMIAFYETPVGKKLSEATPKISQDAMQLGQKIGMEMATELQQELRPQ